MTSGNKTSQAHFFVKRLLCHSFILFYLLAPNALGGGIPIDEERRIEAQASSAFMIIVTLWQDENYAALYGYGDEESRKILSRKMFGEIMRDDSWRLACCWEKVQDVKTTVKSRSSALVRAKLGYEMKFDTGSVKFVTQTFNMTLEDGGWKVDLQEIAYQDPYTLPPRFPGLPVSPLE